MIVIKAKPLGEHRYALDARRWARTPEGHSREPILWTKDDPTIKPEDLIPTLLFLGNTIAKPDERVLVVVDGDKT